MISVEWFEVGDDAFAVSLEERRQHDFLAECRDVFIDTESRAVGRDLEENVARLAEVQTSELVAVNFSAVRNAE